VLTTAGAILLGILAGLRHAFEPDHLSAMSTLVADAGDARRGARSPANAARGVDCRSPRARSRSSSGSCGQCR